MDIVGRFGASVLSNLRLLGDLAGIFTLTLRESRHFLVPARRRIFWFLFKRQLYNSGFRAAYANTLIAILLGFILVSVAHDVLPAGVSITDYYSNFFVLVAIREIGPLVSGIILISRSASAVTAEVGHSKLEREFEILEAHRMSPVLLFWMPVFYAFPLSLLLMFLWFNVVCMLSSYAFLLLATDYASNIGLETFISAILWRITEIEMLVSLAKAILGGMFIGMISILFATRVEGKYTDIPRAISNSSTAQLFVFFAINASLSVLAYR